MIEIFMPIITYAWSLVCLILTSLVWGCPLNTQSLQSIQHQNYEVSTTVTELVTHRARYREEKKTSEGTQVYKQP